MRVVSLIVAVLLSSCSRPLIGQAPSTAIHAACGDLRQKMAVDLASRPKTVQQPEPGKALIYFIQDTGYPTWSPLTKIGIDGKWVGANKRNSFFSVNVAPGEHHLCAVIQSFYLAKILQLAHLTVEPGKVYYYRTRIVLQPEYLSFEPVDSDDGAYLVASYHLATAHAQK